MDEQIQDKISRLELLEQNSSHMAAQRQGFRAQLMEIESAIEDLSDDGDAYRIVGNIMVKKCPSVLRKDLDEKKEVLKVRIESLDKQQDDSKKKAKLLQDEIMKYLQDQKQE